MYLAAVWSLFEQHLFDAPPQPGLFNPYRDHDPAYDRPDAVARRRDNLRRYLAVYTERPPLFLLAEAPGPWGCRFSGVPITSEAQLADPDFPMHGRPSSLAEKPHGEYSANIYWRVMRPYFPHFFTWNSVPFHPYKSGQPLSIRTPRTREVMAHAGLLTGLLGILQPKRTLAIGRKAEHLLTRLDVAAIYVRHPSQGGAKLFEAGVRVAAQEMGLPAAGPTGG